MNTPSTEEKFLLKVHASGRRHQPKHGHRKKNQKLNTLRICGSSLTLISESFLLFILLLIFLHSKLHGEHALEDLL